MPDAIDLQAVLAQVEQQQRLSEASSAMVEIETRAAFRKAFHAMLRDEATPIEDVKAYFDAHAGIDKALMNARYLGQEELDFCRAELVHSPLVFSQFEPPVMMWVLLRAMKTLLTRLSMFPAAARIVIGTDCSYRPHAQVTCHADGLIYEIRLGRFLLDSMIGLARMVDDLISAIRSGEPDLGLADILVADRLVRALQGSLHRYQLPYFLVSIHEGEKFRFGLLSEEVDGDDGRHARSFFLATLMASFMLGHELAHIRLGHLSDEPREVQPLYGMLLAPGGGSRLEALARLDVELVESYRRELLPRHDMELCADLIATGLTIDCSTAISGNHWAGVTAVAVVTAAIALFDRMQAFVQHGIDPAVHIGADLYNAGPFVADVLMPMHSHPWGRTRAAVIPFGLMLMEMGENEEPDMASIGKIRSVMHGVNELFSTVGPEAMAILQQVSARPGEWVAYLSEEGIFARYYQKDDSDEYVDGRFHFPPAAFLGVKKVRFPGTRDAGLAMPPWPPASGVKF